MEIDTKSSVSSELVVALTLMISLTVLAVDTLLPIMNIVSDELFSEDRADTFILCFFWGLALGQLVCGFVSDTIGRKNTLYFGLFVFSLGCLLVLFGGNVHLILTSRFLQGLGASFARTAVIAIIKDLYKGDRFIWVLSLVLSLTNFIFVVSPIIGEVIHIHFGWKYIFVILIIVSIVLIIWVFFRFEESLKTHHRRKFIANQQMSAAASIFTNFGFMSFTLVCGFVQAMILSYLILAKETFSELGLPDQLFAYVFSMIGFSIVVGSYVTSGLTKKFSSLTISGLSLTLIALFSVGFILFNKIILITPLIFMLCCISIFFNVGVLLVSAVSLSMDYIDTDIGLASSMNGAVTMLVGTLVSSFLSVFSEEQELFFVLVSSFFTFSLLGLLAFVIGATWNEAKDKS